MSQGMKGQRMPARKLPRSGLVQQPFNRNFFPLNPYRRKLFLLILSGGFYQEVFPV